MKQKQKQHIQSIYFLRLFAMMMVVLVHVTAAYATVLPFASEAYQKYHFLNRIVRIEAGIFIVITGLVFFYSYINKPLTKTLWKTYYARRVTYILVPYIVWALIYEFYSYYVGATELNAADIVKRILRGESYYQLHFIFLIVQVYLVLPVFVWLAQKVTIFKKYMWLFGIIIQLGYLMLNNTYHITSFNLFLNTMATFLLGGWIGIYYREQVDKKYSRSNSVLFLVTLGAGIAISLLNYHLYTMKTIQISGFTYEAVNTLYLVAGSYFFFRIAEILAEKLSVKSVTIVKNIAMYSFGFYLIHPMVLNFVAKAVPIQGNYMFHIEILARYILTLAGCYLIIWGCHRLLPFASFLFGKLPKEAVFIYRRPDHK
ncbi:MULTISPECIES: acyltransferase [Priestia]|uniref:acyltransferase n=1 Tax=Priestia TaxID=2800373 RepID=UPI000BFBCBD3|nr:acyltransferase [Priestia megaterium]PGY50129.1 acyltransferase [Priestia megaterium]